MFLFFIDFVFVVWMVIIGDCVYNFVDGLVIGVIFIQSLIEGLFIVIVVLCYEILYEFGEFYFQIYDVIVKDYEILNCIVDLFCYVKVILLFFWLWDFQ